MALEGQGSHLGIANADVLRKCPPPERGANPQAGPCARSANAIKQDGYLVGKERVESAQ